MFIDLLDWSIGEKWKLCLSTTVSYILMALLKGGKGCAEFIGVYLQFTCQFGVRDFLRVMDDDN